MQIGLCYQGNPSLVPDVLETLFVCLPHRQYLDQEVALSDDTVHKYSDVVLEKLNKTIEELRRLFLVEDLVDSIKVRLLLLRDQFCLVPSGSVFIVELDFSAADWSTVAAVFSISRNTKLINK
ncbi:hypothetical protein ILYODFUR_037362 [Ilyodon furcidens]|uniref:Reticulon domain-containing protein n=1 Tax=Ilyodon furcidens TaxID=33524 RepID=A0ABV0TFQ1_9TELE